MTAKTNELATKLNHLYGIFMTVKKTSVIIIFAALLVVEIFSGNSCFAQSTETRITDRIIQEQQFRIVCVESPNNLSGVLTWSEPKKNPAEGVNAHYHRVDIGSDSAPSPTVGDTSYSFLPPIVARARFSEFTSSQVTYERSTQPALRIVNNGREVPYCGEWLLLQAAETPSLQFLYSGNQLPSETKNFSMTVIGSSVVLNDMKWTWKLEMQRRVRTQHYKNGILEDQLTTYSAWKTAS